MKTSTLLKIAAELGAGRWVWTVNEIVYFVRKHSGHCKTINEARIELEKALNN